MDRWVGCAKSFQTNLIWPSPVPYNGRYSVRPERKEEQEEADLHLFWVRPESEKVHQKLRGAAFRVLREEKTTEIRPIFGVQRALSHGRIGHQNERRHWRHFLALSK